MEAKLEARAQHPDFDADFRERFHALLAWRRDVRRFRRDPLPPGTIERLIDIACLSPSVGLSEPWRFVIVDDQRRRAAIRDCFELCNQDALKQQEPDRASLYARLKLAGLDDAPCQIAVFADRAHGARPWARAPHHARDARLLRGHRHPHAMACGAGGGHRRRLGVDPRSGDESQRSWRCRRIGPSSGISASAIRRRSTMSRRFNARAGSGGTLRRARSFTDNRGPGCCEA